MAGVNNSNFWLTITHSRLNLKQEKNYDYSLKVAELKAKLELVCGTAPQFQEIQLVNEDGTTKTLPNDKTLLELGVEPKSTILIIDSSPELKQQPVPEYKFDDEKYKNNPNSMRNLKKKLKEEKKQEAIKLSKEAAEKVKVGMRCESAKGRGEVRFVGEIKGQKAIFVGIALDLANGRNNGTLKGMKLFECDENHGSFLRAHLVRVGDFPPLEDDEL